MVLGESRGLAQARTHALKAKKGEAFSRLKCLFPYSPDTVVRQMIRLCPNEEAAVARMLVLVRCPLHQGMSHWVGRSRVQRAFSAPCPAALSR